jgi:hypothetical protein
VALGMIPGILKYSKVIPVYKNGNKFCIFNCRSILLLITFSKIFEKVMCKRVGDFLNSSNLADEQFGFRKNPSTEKALFSLTDEICCTLNIKVHVDGISYDLVKEFGYLNCKLLLMKQQFYRIQGITGQWFKYYINNREEIKSLFPTQNTYSKWGMVNQGVMQGLVLGPFMFPLMYQ